MGYCSVAVGRGQVGSGWRGPGEELFSAKYACQIGGVGESVDAFRGECAGPPAVSYARQIDD
jgi:hypothetical protein